MNRHRVSACRTTHGLSIPRGHACAQPAALDECDVLQLHLSATNPTGYKGVYVKRGTGRFEAKVCSHGQLHHIGNFDTALEAAEAYARHVRLLESA